MPINPAPDLSVIWSDAPQQELLLEFALASVPKPDQLADLKALVDTFVKVGNHGGFPREIVSPFDSSLFLVQANFSSPIRPTFLVIAREVDIRAFQLLRHLAWRWSNREQLIHSVLLSNQTPGQQLRKMHLPDATWVSEKTAYPPQSQLLQMRIDREDPADYQKERRCVVEFGRRVSGNIFETLLTRIAEWVELLGKGAYGPPVKPAFEAEVWQENLAAYDEYSVELAFSLFEASEFAWNALLNCLQHYSLTVEPIVLVVIE